MLDLSRMNFSGDFFSRLEPEMARVYRQIDLLEKGSIANPDENRMVGHYWLRNPELAPAPEITGEIRQTLVKIKAFARKVNTGEVLSEKGQLFKNVLLIGIGGSSLGPRFVSDALGSRQDRMSLWFIDNTDPDGIDRVFGHLEAELAATLCIVISKSGGTVETRNGMLEAQQMYRNQGLDFARHAICITQDGSKLHQTAQAEGWLQSFPMWDWVGGRTSVLSSVGLVALALQGIDIEALLAGARLCDEQTRKAVTPENPAALLALMWYKATGGQGGSQMVMLPYKDRLELFSKYMQQLIME
ncbi:MAG TPA: glucose-6-phosphate isomerase, partial [Bacillota bacterium]|nr:glucose-6-phosphate isomerase [Bacillota bacterium]